MKFSVPRGTNDILPEEMPFWHKIEEISRSIFDLYNYAEIRTPIFEVTELFQRTIGDTTDIVEKEMYTFLDKSDRKLTLRPEGTAPIARAYIENNFAQTQKKVKFYYIGPMFRYERPQAGRFRQFHQIGVENIGADHPSADAEMISMGIHLFDELGLSDLTVSINSVGCEVCRPVIKERLKQFLGSNLKFLCPDCQRRFEKNPLRILDCKKPKCQNYFLGISDIKESICRECSDHFNSVLEYLDALGIIFKVNSRLVRGLDYYSKTTFEIISSTLGAQNAICGGGRYDKLIEEIGGPPTPAVGFAFGEERAVMILKQMAEQKISVNNILVYLAPMGENQRKKAFNILDELRRAGVKCEMDFVKDDLKSHLKHANKLQAKYTLIFGEDEAEKNCMLKKEMATGKQEEISLDNLINHFANEQKI